MELGDIVVIDHPRHPFKWLHGKGRGRRGNRTPNDLWILIYIASKMRSYLVPESILRLEKNKPESRHGGHSLTGHVFARFVRPHLPIFDPFSYTGRRDDSADQFRRGEVKGRIESFHFGPADRDPLKFKNFLRVPLFHGNIFAF